MSVVAKMRKAMGESVYVRRARGGVPVYTARPMFDIAPARPEPPGRRVFPSAAAAAATSLLLGRRAAADAPFAARRERALSFFNTHTGETVSAVYWADGVYRDEALGALNRVLR